MMNGGINFPVVTKNKLSRAEYAKLKKKKPKYNNTKYHGFDSEAEYRRFRELLLLEKVGQISELETQVPYTLLEKQPGQRAIKIVVDFQYVEGGKPVVEDFKGFRTQVYLMKKKMFCARYPGIEFRESC